LSNGVPHCLDPLIAYLRTSAHPWVVVGLQEPDGLRCRAESESACRAMVEVVGGPFKAMPRVDFLELVLKVREEEIQEVER
jgi:hypothetical protein